MYNNVQYKFVQSKIYLPIFAVPTCTFVLVSLDSMLVTDFFVEYQTSCLGITLRQCDVLGTIKYLFLKIQLNIVDAIS